MRSSPESRAGYKEALIAHCRPAWGEPIEKTWSRGPTNQLAPGFSVLQYSPGAQSGDWISMTSGMSLDVGGEKIELFFRSSTWDDELVELLYAVAHYHRTGAHVGLHHCVNFGRPWLKGSLCSRGFISLPYADGPKVEQFQSPYGLTRILWLFPITNQEHTFVLSKGAKALEEQFEQARVDYSNPLRPSVV